MFHFSFFCRGTNGAVITLLCTSLFMSSLALVSAEDALTSEAPLVSEQKPKEALDFMLGNWRIQGRALQADGTYTADSFSERTVTRLFSESDVAGVMIHGYPPKDGNVGQSAFNISYFETYRIFIYHDKSQSWRGIGHNTLGNRKWLDGFIDGNEFYFDQRGELFRGAKGLVRFTYHDIKPGSYKVRIDYSADEGTTWKKGTYLMDATRIDKAKVS